MAKPPRPWIVTRHGPLQQLEENLWVVTSDVPGFPPGVGFDRRMTIVRLSDGRLLFHNAIPVDEPTLAQIQALGRPSILLVAHHLHCIDGRAFRERLGLSVYSAATSLDKTRAICPVDGPFEEAPRDPAYSLVTLPSSRFGEVGVVVHSGKRSSLSVCDIVVHVQHGRGLPGLIFRVLGFTGPDLKLPLPVRLRAFPDKAKVKQDLEALAALPNLVRLIPSHGPIIDDDPAGALRRVAAGL